MGLTGESTDGLYIPEDKLSALLSGIAIEALGKTF